MQAARNALACDFVSPNSLKMALAASVAFRGIPTPCPHTHSTPIRPSPLVQCHSISRTFSARTERRELKVKRPNKETPSCGPKTVIGTDHHLKSLVCSLENGVFRPSVTRCNLPSQSAHQRPKEVLPLHSFCHLLTEPEPSAPGSLIVVLTVWTEECHVRRASKRIAASPQSTSLSLGLSASFLFFSCFAFNNHVVSLSFVPSFSSLPSASSSQFVFGQLFSDVFLLFVKQLRHAERKETENMTPRVGSSSIPIPYPDLVPISGKYAELGCATCLI